MAQLTEELPAALHTLTTELDQKTHVLASQGDEGLAAAALQAAKALFDLGASPLSSASQSETYHEAASPQRDRNQN